MGASPSTQDDLMSLKSCAATDRRRQDAFSRLRQSLTKRLTPQELLQAVARVEQKRFEVWQRPSGDWDKELLADKVRGLVFGAALGDAAGLATEFLSKVEATGFYGQGCPDFAPGRPVYPDEHRIMWCPGDWTDDTDQQVLVVQSLLDTAGKADPRDFAAKLVAWRKSGFPDLGDESSAGLGRTTKAVLNDADFLADPMRVAEAHSASIPANGAVMRTAVTGVPFFWDDAVVLENTTAFCRTTHADPRCLASCIAVSLCISRILQGTAMSQCQERDVGDVEGIIDAALDRASDALQGQPQWIEEMKRFASAGCLAELHLDEASSIGYTYKAMGSGLWALRNHKQGFRQTINMLISEAGDADTNATVAGALLGCQLGYRQLPQDWIAGMPYSSWLEAHVQKLLFMLGLRG
eukprot:TRINITY_DN112116_c0_g1_i1.p1 TRINITY_DN112116_c0_g1~~TRINITY_DN112116_c0_g1_i1.p1  ORF type:complete len:435 (+),score=48.64 TRINITY_DN112116_c0_g1_i1:81-1307(+)